MPVTIRGDRKAKQRIASMRRRTEDMRPAWPEVGAYIARTVRKQFASQGAYLGTPWKPLKPAYRQWKVRNGYPRTILVMGGSMRRSWTSRPMSIEIYRKQSATFGSSDRKTVWHHYGTHRKGKRVNPARPMFKATRGVSRDIKDIVQNRIVGKR